MRKAFGPGRWRKLKGIAFVRFEDGTIHRVELHWYEAHGLGRKKVKIKSIWIKSMAKESQGGLYVLCINDGGYPESLEVRKIYAVLTDERATARKYIRVIDETGEDYLYPAKYFVPIQVPPEATRILTAASKRT